MFGKLFGPSSEDILNAYLIEVIRRTAFRDVPKPSKQEIEQVAAYIKEFIGNEHEIHEGVFRVSDNEEFFDESLKRLLPYGSIMLYILFGYEALCHRGPTADDFPFFSGLIARIVEYHAPNSYRVIDDMIVNTFDSTTKDYIRKLEKGDGGLERFRYRFILTRVLRILAYPAADWWPDKNPKVVAWAEDKLKSLSQYWGSDSNVMRYVDFEIGQFNQDMRETYHQRR